MACRNRLSSIFGSCFQYIHQSRVLATGSPTITRYPTVSHNHMTVRYVTRGKKPAASNKEKETVPGYRIAVTKGFDSQHTGSLEGSFAASDRLLDDIMIRKYINGVFYDSILSDVIIKRRDNRIIIAFVIDVESDVNKIYFLTAMSEKLLSEVFGCIVTFEPQSAIEVK